jgi:hypothetical protein
MDWLILLVIVPAVVVPIVLLWGFSGCSFCAPLGPPVPMNLRVTETDFDFIRIEWDEIMAYTDCDDERRVVTIDVEIQESGSTDPPILQEGLSGASYLHAGLQPATIFFFRVRSVVTKDFKSAWSDPVPGWTLVFRTAFEQDFSNGNDDGANAGACTVQRIEPARLLRGGTLPSGKNKVRITLRAATNGPLRLDLVTISKPAAAGDEYDSGPDLTQVATTVTVPANESVVLLPPVAYTLDQDAPLLIAFNIKAAGEGNFRFVGQVPTTDARMFIRQDTAEAQPNRPDGSADRTSGYNDLPRIHSVERIEVATADILPFP